jgi:ABC-2 type transport system permease protein
MRLCLAGTKSCRERTRLCLLGGFAYLFTVFASSVGVEHKLLVYGRDPGFEYSDLSGFGPSLEPLL